MKPIILFFVLIFEVITVRSWDLSSWGFDRKYYVSSIAVYGTRTFLALPRSVCHNGEGNPTVVEISKTGEHFFVTLNVRHKILDYQKWKDCAHIQDAVSLAIDPRRHKLWILDKGNDVCQPKVVSFSLFYNALSESIELTNVSGDALNTMVIDYDEGSFGYRAYIGNAGENELLVLSLVTLNWWRVQLSVEDHPDLNVNAVFMSISKTDPDLFITGNGGTEMYSLSLTTVRNMEEPTEIEDDISVQNVTFRGHKLGISSCLETDYKSGVSYFMVRDNAIVRWITEFPIRAEYHNVLAQSFEKLPYVSLLFTGPQNGLWALVNPFGPEDCSKENASDVSHLEYRLIRIFRYNKFVNQMDLQDQINF